MDVSPSVLRAPAPLAFCDDRSDTLRVFAPDREAYAQAAPSHDLPSNEAYNLAHHRTTGRCAPQRNAPAYIGSGVTLGPWGRRWLMSASPPNVWTRRALQEKTVSLEYGLAPMYQASLWSSCSGPSWKSARIRSC